MDPTLLALHSFQILLINQSLLVVTKTDIYIIMMDTRLLEQTILRNDMQAFLNLIHDGHRDCSSWRHEDLLLVNSAVPSSDGQRNSVLHLVSRFGQVEMAAEVVKLLPEMVALENEKMETPLHEACREGHLEMVKLLLSVDAWVFYKVNRDQQSPFYVACDKGKIEVVKYLLEFQWLRNMEMNGSSTSSLHAATDNGHIGVVKELIKAFPELASKRDSNGNTPLHLACIKGHLEITRELLKLDSDLSILQDNQGRTPLHWAATKGRVNVMDEILSVSLESSEMVTMNGETVLHLGVKNNQYDAVKYLTEKLNVSKLLDVLDHDGNTILHLASAGKLTTMVIYLIKSGAEINSINRKGYTALDVVERDASNSGALLIMPALIEAGAKRCDQLPPFSSEILQMEHNSGRYSTPSMASPDKHNQLDLSPRQLSGRHRKSPHGRRRERHMRNHREGLRNARNTITVVAVLIATVTFTAGINPPGGYNQNNGRAIMGRQTPFKVFMVCNIVALFLSLGIVLVLVSIIPFHKKTMKKLLVLTHKVMLASVSFMASAYIAAVWTIMPHVPGTMWLLAVLVAIGGGCTVTIAGSLGLMLATHYQDKKKWRQMKERKNGISPHGSQNSRISEMRTIKKGSRDYSSDSDLESSDRGYILY